MAVEAKKTELDPVAGPKTELDVANSSQITEASSAVEPKLTETSPLDDPLILRLRQDYPHLRFKIGRKFTFRPPRTIIIEPKDSEEKPRTIIIEPKDSEEKPQTIATEPKDSEENNSQKEQKIPQSEQKGPQSEQKNDFYRLQILHEVGHAILEHEFYQADVERLKMERAAWEKARELCLKYQGEFGVEYDENFVEEALDSYRDWLHVKSRCPRCGVTRFQDRKGRYFCPECDSYKI